MNNQSNQPSIKKNCDSSLREPTSPAASAWYTTPAWNATGSTLYPQSDNTVDIGADSVTSTPGVDHSTQVERSGMGRKRPCAAAVLSSRNSQSTPKKQKTHHDSLPTHSPIGSSRSLSPFDISSDEDISPPLDSPSVRFPRAQTVAISDQDWRLFNQKPMDTADGSGRTKKYQCTLQDPEEDHATFNDRYEVAAKEMKSWHQKMEQACKFSSQTFRRFLLPEEVNPSEIAFLSTKRKLRYIGLFNV
uniref:Uncharacterized protein n=1 Tax=Parastrongyloides trichosuri TaxID=131310 RepID=A0A0N5A0X0_PARTI